jgi:hypothetical protein
MPLNIYRSPTWRSVIIFEKSHPKNSVSPRFLPIAARRGVPQDPSQEVSADLAEYDPSFIENVTWLHWAEIAHIDWSRAIEWPTVDIEIYSNTPNGPLFWGTKSHASLLSRDDDDELIRLGSLERRGHIYKVRQGAASLEASDQWKLLFTLCRDLSNTYGPLGVRLIAWFE